MADDASELALGFRSRSGHSAGTSRRVRPAVDQTPPATCRVQEALSAPSSSSASLREQSPPHCAGGVDLRLPTRRVGRHSPGNLRSGLRD